MVGMTVIPGDDLDDDSTVLLLPGDTPLLTPDTGLLQSRRTDDGAQFVALLMPGLRQGDRVRVERQGFSGDWLVREVEHRGDSGYADDYYTTIEARPA
jgi:hypothetical protein